MAEQKIRNAYKNFMFKFSPFLNTNKNIGSVDLVDDKSVSDFHPQRFNFYSQVMESIVNSNPEIVKKVFNTVNLFKYKHDKMEKDIMEIKQRMDGNKKKIVDTINAYLPEGVPKLETPAEEADDEIRRDPAERLAHTLSELRNNEEVKKPGAPPAGPPATTPTPKPSPPAPEPPVPATAAATAAEKAEAAAKKKADEATVKEETAKTNFIIKIKEELTKLKTNTTTDGSVNSTDTNNKIFKSIDSYLLEYYKNIQITNINNDKKLLHNNSLKQKIRKLHSYSSITFLHADLQKKPITNFTNIDYSKFDIRELILDALYAALIFNNNDTEKQTKMIAYTEPQTYAKLEYKFNIILKELNNTDTIAISGGAPDQQIINNYLEDIELSPNIDKVNLRDRGIFIVLIFIIRAIALFITEWAIYSGFINSFMQSFGMYFGIYICIFILVIILTNVNNEDITFFRELFYYVNAEAEDGKGLIRIILQMTCILVILPIPYMVKDFRLKDTSPNKILTYTDKSNIYYSVDKFSLYVWILTSIVALSV